VSKVSFLHVRELYPISAPLAARQRLAAEELERIYLLNIKLMSRLLISSFKKKSDWA
jgi:hypothetical protein